MKLKTLIAAGLIALFSAVSVQAKELTQQKSKTEGGYNFWLQTPDDTKTKKPVVIFLHGRSLCGNDLNKVKNYGTIDAIQKGREIDAYVIAPQNPGGSWKPEKVMEILEWVEKNHNVDTDRVYVLGMSLGGYGTMDFAAAYPDKVAAAVAMCGGTTSKHISHLNQLPLWIIHGTGDSSVSVSKSDNVVEKMKESDPKTKRLSYSRIPGMNHSQPARFFYLPEMYEWLFKHNLKEKGRPIHPTFDVASKMSSAYKGLDFSGSKKSKSKSSSKKSSDKTKSVKKKKK